MDGIAITRTSLTLRTLGSGVGAAMGVVAMQACLPSAAALVELTATALLVVCFFARAEGSFPWFGD